MTRVFNFSAGPAALPEPVLRQAAEEMLDWHGSGMSVMEMSHRGKEFIAIHAEAEALLRKLLAVPANYKVLFMQGGAIGENAIVPMNMLRGKKSADYIDTGEWSKKSIKEAQNYCTVNVAASGKDSDYTRIPPRDSGSSTPTRPTCTSLGNETIGGVEFHWTPDIGAVPLVADMSSNILSRPIDVSKYGLIYAGAQKNMGPSGLTIVIVRDDLIGHALPIMPVGVRLQDAGRQRLDVQHAAHLCDLHRRAGVQVDRGARRPAGDGSAQPQEGGRAVRLPRRHPLLPMPGGAARTAR